MRWMKASASAMRSRRPPSTRRHDGEDVRMPFGELQIAVGIAATSPARDGGEGGLDLGKRFVDDEIEDSLHVVDMVVERHGFAAQCRRQAPGAQRRQPLAVDERKGCRPDTLGAETAQFIARALLSGCGHIDTLHRKY